MYIESEKGLKDAIDWAAKEFVEQAYIKPTPEEKHLTFNAMNRALQVILNYQRARMGKQYLVGYKDDYLVFGHGDIAKIQGIKPIDLEEARRAVMELPSTSEVIVYQLVPVKVYPADLDQRAAVAREEARESTKR